MSGAQVSVEDVKAALKSLGAWACRRRRTAACSAQACADGQRDVADKDGDGQLNYEEFATWWAQAAKLEAAPAAAPGAAKPAAAEAAGAGADAPPPRGK